MTVYRGCVVAPDRHYDVEGDLWVRFEGELARVGMTDVAQTRMGKMVSIRFKKPGRHVPAGGSVATVESAKWVGPIHVPFPCEVVEVNREAYDRDILIANRDPYGEGWVAVVRPDDLPAAQALLTPAEEAAESYRRRIDELDVNCFRCAD